MSRDKVLGYIALATICIVWGTTYLAIRVAVETLPDFLFPGIRFLLGGSLLLGVCLIRGERLPRRWRDYGNLALIGFLMVGVGNVAVVWAERTISSGFAALLVATAPFWMAILEAMRRDGERITLRKVVGMSIGFGGVALLVAPEVKLSNFDGRFIAGVVLLQIGSIAWNIGSIRSKYHPIDATPLVSASLQMILGALAVTAIGLAKGEASQMVFTTRTLLAFLYLTIFGSFIAYTAYVYALSKLPTTTVSLYAYVNPAIAVVLGWAILNEPLGIRAIGAMVIILFGVAVVQRGRGAKQEREPALEAEDAHA